MTDRPLRFCFVSTFYPPYNFGGDGIAVSRLAVALAERGHHVEVVHCLDAYRLLQSRGVPPSGSYLDHPSIVHHGLHSRLGAISPLITHQTGLPGLKRRALRRILRDGAFDVVHFHNPSLIGPAALGYPKAITLYTMHEHWLVCPMHVLWKFNREPCSGKQCIRCQVQGGRPPQLWRYSGLLARHLRNVDAFIAPSLFTREKHLGWGLTVQAPIAHIPNFLSVPAPAPVTDPLPHSRPYFLYVGRLERIKGAHTLIDVFRRYPHADLLLAGAGSESAALRAQAADCQNIRFLGLVPAERVDTLMRHAIAVLVPSVGYEVFPTTILEANAQGTPVVGHRLGPIPEMIEGHGGLTYGDEAELLTALASLQENPAMRRTLGERGRVRFLTDWTTEQHLAQYFSLINTLQAERASFA